MKKTVSYFQTILRKYINDHHPLLVNDISFINSRADEALTVYEQTVKDGLTPSAAEELASETLYSGLHFSTYDFMVELLWNEFPNEIPQGLAERLAALLLGNTAVKKTFAKYSLDDNFSATSEYDLLYSEMTGVVQIIIERNDLPTINT